MMQEQPAPVWTARRNLRNMAQLLTVGALVVLVAAASIATLLAMTGLLPWLPLNLTSTTGDSLLIGPWVQVLGTVFLLGLCAFLPGVHQIQSLEKSHREFKLSMDDVARAYQISHATDRSGTFTLSAEFEDMRDRLDTMRRHPDLGHLEPEILEVAAQMSHVTRDLALIYSEKKVARAKDFLRQRQHELDAFSEKLGLALRVTQDLQRWQKDVEASELEVNRQVDRLEKDLQEILPQLGYEMDEDRLEEPKADDDNVVTLSAGGSSKTSQAALAADPHTNTNGHDRPN